MTGKRCLSIRYYRDVIGDLQIPDIVLPALAMREIIHAAVLQLQSYRGDEGKPKCAEILREEGELLERIALTPQGARLTTPNDTGRS